MAAIGPQLSCEQASADFFAPLLLHRPREHVVAAHLDGRARVVATSEAGSACPGSIELPVRTIVADALAHEACAVVVAHHHPSGDPTPSRADIEATRALEQALRPLGIRLYDHIILAAGGRRTSFRRLGWL